ncbi:hypothetical protein LG277_05495 [Vreelandella aquamarina]|uniref:hypothetical protein n=1 Tax=Vreelandella aquamarina TaxID=77097 RepID=UPI00384BD954
MQNNRLKDYRSYVCVIAFMVPGVALAASASGELEVQAGIDNSITVVCNQALSFGITTFTTDALSTEMTVAVDESGALTATDAPDLSSLGNGQAGECTLFNATPSNETNIGVTFSETSEFALDGDGVLGLASAGSPSDDLLVTLDSASEITPEVDGNGQVTFNVTGSLKFPTNAPTNPGGYGGTVDVTVNDSP